MQHLTPATQAVLDALRELGQGNVGELADKSGKARSTTDKAIKTLADAGVIVAVDADADAAEGNPTRWTLSDHIAAQADNSDLTNAVDLNDDPAQTQDGLAADRDGDTDDTDPVADNDDEGVTAEAGDNAFDEETDADDQDEDDQNADQVGDKDDDRADDEHAEEAGDEDGDNDEEDDRGAVNVVQPSRPGDRKVMTIKAVLAEHGDDGATLDEIVAESGIGYPTASRLLTAMKQADAARSLPGRPQRWIAGPTKASEVDPNPQPARCPLCLQLLKGVSEFLGAVSEVPRLARPDGTLHIVAADGTAHVVTLPKRMPTRTTSINNTTTAARRTDLTVNADGSQPFAKGELEKLTMGIFAANPGREMTPQEVATAISAHLGGREVSSGAVRNNCGKLGAAGHIAMVSESPWKFVLPAPTADADADQADDATTEQS